jgi:SAM-dependent methyltransferase
VKLYDRAYFDRWYRNRRTRVKESRDLDRRVAHLVATAELLLGRKVRSALDVGCGEGAWMVALRKLRPAIRCIGVDPSDYVVQRYGRSRGIRKGSFGDLGNSVVRRSFDLVICADVLHYVPSRDVKAGLPEVAARLIGVAYMPVFTTEDAVIGDLEGWHDRTPGWYRKAFRRAGLVSCGMNMYVSPELADDLSALEIAE